MFIGPSLGLAMSVALAALVLRRDLEPHVLMTGEMDLRGNVHAIGDVLLKIEAGMKEGMLKVLIPYDNYQDLDLEKDLEGKEELREYILEHVHPVKDLIEALTHALQGDDGILHTYPHTYPPHDFML
jgi:Lon-like ATP-dependent protease